MVSAEVTVLNSLGLHARPIAKLVKTLSGNSDHVVLKKGDKTADAKNIYQVIALNARCGDKISLSVEGDGENETLTAVMDLFEKKFNET
ncbi:MAG: HPr family phosphocarrier protein [Clostridiales bacterium]|nr:HPr family phosphocarrier protein [Clostridiales bacterium]MDY4180042.1 HPr family phosphocarrier protein [Pseudoflavonifractor sp.]